MKQESTTRFAIQVGSEIEIVNESKYNKLKEDAVKSNQEAPEAIAVQTFVTYEAENDEDAVALSPDPAVRIAHFNRGVSLRQLNEMRSLMESATTTGPDAFQITEGAYDLREICNQAPERRKMSPEDKALKALEALPPEVLQGLLARFLNKATAPDVA